MFVVVTKIAGEEDPRVVDRGAKRAGKGRDRTIYCTRFEKTCRLPPAHEFELPPPPLSPALTHTLVGSLIIYSHAVWTDDADSVDSYDSKDLLSTCIYS